MVTVPRPATGLVDRARLFALLDRGVEGRVTLVCGPAGSGKSTLVSSWLRGAELPGPAVWVAVDRDESDATRFWATALDALRSSGALAPGAPLATPRSARPACARRASSPRSARPSSVHRRGGRRAAGGRRARGRRG